MKGKHVKSAEPTLQAKGRARLVRMAYAGGVLLGLPAGFVSANAPDAQREGSAPVRDALAQADPGGPARWAPGAAKPSRQLERGRLIHQQAGMFGLLVVTEDAYGLRTLRFGLGGPRQSVVKPGYPRQLELRYTRASMLGLALVENPQRILVVGLGGGSLPMFLRSVFPLVHIDAVDVDPAVIQVARRFLDFREDPFLHAHAVDGRRFVEAVQTPYDLILLDAYSSEAVPAHLTTREFLKAVLRAIQPAGIVVSNLWGPSMNPLFASMLRTYKEVFAEVYLIELPGVENRIVLALAQARTLDAAGLTRLARETSRRLGLPFDLSVFVEEGFRSYEPSPDQEAVLRD